ncbi:viral a-type inclusion protein [Neofusicoccum parvum]|uniref:Viral a-type inclusion protein n=1 Tax=Neofusicoccum parvum TaxID=310453 RepID=A0ACB5S547_9PEZI|nr:viral a-type inclusion protein [Neofusicoccum parvum]
MALEDRYESPEATDYKLERRRETDRRLSLPHRPLDLVLYKPPGGKENHRRSPGNRASSSLDLIGQSPATSGGSDTTTTSVQRLQEKVTQLQRAATRESNRTAELTRLNAVVLQRNKTIAELQRENTALRGENVRVCGALAARTEMAVALHGIGGRQQEFMRSFGGAVYADAGQRRGFEAWVQSNELYMMHVREEISGERRWEEVVAKANAMAMREIGRLAHQAAHDAAQRAVQQMAQQGGPPPAQQVAQQIMQQASLQHFGP